MACESCGAEIPSGSGSCPNCGLILVLANVQGRPNWADLSLRIAGLALILNGFVLIAEGALPSGTDDSLVQSPSGAVGSILIGVMLALRRTGWIPLARFAVVLGAVLFTGLWIYRQEPYVACLQLVFSLSLVALIFGTPSRGRVIGATVGLSCYFAIAILGVAAISTGRNPLAELLYTTSPLDNGVARGTNVEYEIRAPNDEWELRDRAEAQEDNPSVDLWLVNKGYDAHVTVIVDHFDSGYAVVEKLREVVLRNYRDETDSFDPQVLEGTALRPFAAEIISADAVVSSIQLRFRIGVVAAGAYGFQITCLASPSAFAHVDSDCDSIINSFQFDPSPGSSSYNLVAVEGGRASGSNQHYSVSDAGGMWLLRSAGEAQLDNPDADLWLTHRLHDVHLVVVANDAGEGMQFDPGRMANETLRTLSPAASPANRRIVQAQIGEGVVLDVVSPDDENEYRLAFFSEGRLGFKVVAFGRPSSMRLAAEDLGIAIQSFAVESSDRVLEWIAWSENLGCFERHLQRRFKNPLFPPARRVVTTDQLTRARERDAAEASAIQSELLRVAAVIEDLPNTVDIDTAMRLRGAIDELAIRAVRAEGAGAEFRSSIAEIRHAIIDSVRNGAAGSDEALRSLDEAEKFYQETIPFRHNPFLSQLVWDEGPFLTEDVVPSLLSESPETIRLAMAVVDSGGSGDEIRAAALEIVISLESEGEIDAAGLVKKLDAMGVQLGDD